MCIISQVILLLSVSSLAHVSAESVSDTLEVIVTNTRLPSPRAHITTGYDGDDTIYLWGGLYAGVWVNDVLKYSISKQTIGNIGTMPDRAFGSGCWIGNNNFVQMGGFSVGYEYHSDVWNFATNNPSNWTSVTNMPRSMGYSSSVWDEGENTYTIGGSSGITVFNTILKYIKSTQTIVNVGTLPKAMKMPATAWDNTTGSSYIFGGHSNTGYLQDILKFEAVSGLVTTLNVTLPVGTYYACAIWTGKEAHHIGGYSGGSVAPPPIVRFDPLRNEVTTVQVNNFPPRLYGTGCVFVETLNRIYIFGGIAEERHRDQIMYIDLNDSGTPSTTTEESTTVGIPTTELTTEPTAEPSTAATTLPTTEPQTEPTTIKSPIDFECPTETGLHADPKNCRGFYNCDAWFPYHFCCPLPLFYNPTNERCDFHDMVECHNDPGLPCDSPPGKLIGNF